MTEGRGHEKKNDAVTYGGTSELPCRCVLAALVQCSPLKLLVFYLRRNKSNMGKGACGGILCLVFTWALS